MKKAWSLEVFRELLGDALIVICGLTVLLIFIPVLFWGRYYIHEGNPYILWLEIGLGVYIVVFGFRRLVKDIKK